MCDVGFFPFVYTVVRVFLVDFEQPRALVTKVLDDGARARLVENLAGNLGGVKTPAIKARQRKRSSFPRRLLRHLACSERRAGPWFSVSQRLTNFFFFTRSRYLRRCRPILWRRCREGYWTSSCQAPPGQVSRGGP